MASKIKKGDTWPPLRGRAVDGTDTLLPLPDAETITVLIKSGATLVGGAVEVIEPPDDDGYNWRYIWDDDDTAIVGVYSVELEITWDSGTTPPQVETVPNGANPELEIVQDLGGTN